MSLRIGGCLALLLLISVAGLAQPAPLDRVSLRYVPPTLVVEARVNDSPPLLFAFDTGATSVVLDMHAAERLRIRPYAEPPPGRHGAFARVRRLAVGKAVAYDLEVALGDLSELARRLELDLAGILGYTWMEQFIFEIDYAAGRLTLWPRQTELSAAADTLLMPLEVVTGPGFTGANVFIMGQVGASRCLFEIDTGTDLGVLGAEMASRMGTNLAAEPLGGPIPKSPAIRRVDLLAFAGRIFAHVPFRVDPGRGAQGEPYQQCVIGNAQLREFVLTLDIPHRRAFFRSAPPTSQP